MIQSKCPCYLDGSRSVQFAQPTGSKRWCSHKSNELLRHVCSFDAISTTRSRGKEWSAMARSTLGLVVCSQYLEWSHYCLLWSHNDRTTTSGICYNFEYFFEDTYVFFFPNYLSEKKAQMHLSMKRSQFIGKKDLGLTSKVISLIMDFPMLLLEQAFEASEWIHHECVISAFSYSPFKVSSFMYCRETCELLEESSISQCACTWSRVNFRVPG